MSQPPEDRRSMPWETPQEPPEADQPTVPWTPPEPPAIDQVAPDAPLQAADATEAPVETVTTPDGAAEPLAPVTEPPPATPESPLISWAPSGGAAAGAAGAAAAGAGPAGGVTPGGTQGPIVGWESPDAGLAPSPVGGYVTAGVGTRIVAWVLDIILLGLLLAVVFVVVLIAVPSLADDATTLNLISVIVATGLEFVYFVGFWTSRSGATPGMRLVSLRIVSAADGQALDVVPAMIRWAAFGYPLSVLTFIPAVAVVASYALAGWTLVLLLTTAMSPVNQGLHDRWAHSAVVRRAGAGNNAVVIGCLVLALVILGLFVLLPIVALILLGGQLETILSEVGQSI